MGAPPCTPVSPTGCRRRSPPSPPAPSRSRSSLPPRGSTPYGSAAPSSPPCPPSSRCGSRSRSTTSADPPSSTASASKLFSLVLRALTHIVTSIHHLAYNTKWAQIVDETVDIYRQWVYLIPNVSLRLNSHSSKFRKVKLK